MTNPIFSTPSYRDFKNYHVILLKGNWLCDAHFNFLFYLSPSFPITFYSYPPIVVTWKMKYILPQIDKGDFIVENDCTHSRNKLCMTSIWLNWNCLLIINHYFFCIYLFHSSNENHVNYWWRRYHIWGMQL